MSLSPIPRSVEDEEESVMGGLGRIFLLEAAEGEEYYQMMKHRNDGRPLNREINLDD